MEEMEMGKWLRPAFAFLLVALLGVAITACGGSDSSDSSSEGTSPGEAAEISGKITVWDFNYESYPKYTKAIDILDAEFEKLHPGVTVNREAQPFEGYETLVQAAFAAHEGPDAMTMAPGATGVLHFKQGLEVLNDRISPELEEETIGWESVTPGFTAEGDHYGFPFGVAGEILYYNKALFAKAGLPREFKPQSWDEIWEAAETLKKAGIQPFTGGNKEGYENGFWFDYGWQSQNEQQQAIELAEGKIPFTDPLVATAWEPQLKAIESGYYPSDIFSVPLFTEGLFRFGEGDAAMGFGFTNLTGYWGEYNETLGEKNVGIILPPGNGKLGIESNSILSIPTFAKNKDAAWALIEFLGSKKSIELIVEKGGELPSRKDVSLPTDAAVQPQEIMDLVQEGNYVFTNHDMLPGPVFFGPLLTEVNQALQGRISFADAQQAMQEAFEKSAK
jgi:multiple sugar transport system substrate-binding protein